MPPGEGISALTASELRGRLDVAEGVQVDDIDHGAHHPRVVLPNNRPALSVWCVCVLGVGGGDQGAWQGLHLAAPETGLGALTIHFPPCVSMVSSVKWGSGHCDLSSSNAESAKTLAQGPPQPEETDVEEPG